LILRKISEIVAIRCQILRLKCTKFDFGWGSAPDPAQGAYIAAPDPQLGLRGPTFKGSGGEGEEEGTGGKGEGTGKEWKDGEGRGRAGSRGGGGEGLALNIPAFISWRRRVNPLMGTGNYANLYSPWKW